MKKKSVYVNVIGQPMTGKTSIVEGIQKFLSSVDIETVVDWGIDGLPNMAWQNRFQERLAKLAKTTRVVLSELYQTRKSSEEINYEITVAKHADNYIVHMVSLGTPMVASFGSLPISLERARAFAARLGADLNTDVYDTVRDDIEIRQASNFEPA